MVPFLSSTMVHQGSERMDYGGGMKRRPNTRETLVTNLRALMTAAKIGKDNRAKKSGVSERMIGYILSKQKTPTIDVAESLAKPFGLTGWQLLMPNLPVELAKDGRLEKLIDNFANASDTAQQYIFQVAERENTYRTKK